MTGVFLQVRLGSSRLPRKALLPLCGLPAVSHAMRGLRDVPAAVHALLTDEESANELAPLAESNGYELFVGDRENVLSRFVRAAERFNVDTIIRATGDNPFVSARVARNTLALRERENADFAALDGPPLGTGVEVLRSSALQAAAGEGPDAYEKEHVSPFLYRRPERFRIVRESADPSMCLAESSVTLDTAADYAFLTRLCGELYRGAPIEIEALVAWLRRALQEPRKQFKDSA